MKEENIRPEDLMLENSNLFEQDLMELLEHAKNFVNIVCPACGSSNNIVKFKKKGFNFISCKECETLYVNPRPSAGLLGNYYASSKSIKHWNDRIFPATEEYRRNNIFYPRAKRVIELCKKYKTSMDVLVDVGAGFGTFCEEIKRTNEFRKVIAVEPSRELAETCQNKGIEVIAKPVEEVNLDRVSVITNFELIEHLFRPQDFLEDCYKVLDKNGLMIITTPNIKGFDLLVLNELSDNIAGPNHINYFNPDSLELLLKKVGFRVLEVSTPGRLDAELVRDKIIKCQLDVSENPFLKYVLIDKWQELGAQFQEFLASNCLSSHMWVVAIKE